MFKNNVQVTTTEVIVRVLENTIRMSESAGGKRIPKIQKEKKESENIINRVNLITARGNTYQFLREFQQSIQRSQYPIFHMATEKPDLYNHVVKMVTTLPFVKFLGHADENIGQIFHHDHQDGNLTPVIAE
ncbi:hypothetical protein CR513_35777, partial [Mucuna pruriens]